MQIGSPFFDDYTRTLRRVGWAEFIDRQVREERRRQFRASLVGDPFAAPQPERRSGCLPQPETPAVPASAG